MQFRISSKGIKGKEIPESSRLDFLEKFLANNLALSDAEDNTSVTFVENTVINLPNVPIAKFMGSDGLFCFSSICKFDSFKNPFAMITSLPEFYFRFRRYIYSVCTNKKK